MHTDKEINIANNREEGATETAEMDNKEDPLVADMEDKITISNNNMAMIVNLIRLEVDQKE